MKLGNYPTPAQVSVFLGEVWLDDAYRLEVRDNNQLIPLYGYAESEFSAVAQGKRIVNGSLIINYRYPEYLRAAIDGHGRKKVGMDRTVALAHALRNASVEERIAILEQARMNGVGREMRDVFVDKYVSVSEAFGNVPGLNNYGENLPTVLPSSMRTDPNEDLELRIWFDTPNKSRYYTIIEGVRLVGKAMTIRNAANSGGDASSSGQNLFELYTFFARRIINRKVAKSSDPTQPGYGATSQQELLGSLVPTPKREGSES